MSPRQLEKHLSRFSWRYRLVRAWTMLQLVVFAAFCAAALLILVDRLVYLRLDLGLVVPVVVVAAVAVLLGYTFLLARQLTFVAYLVDRSLGLRNLVATALELGPRNDELAQVLRARAVAALKPASPAKVLPARWAWYGKHAYAPALLAVALWFMPPQDFFGRQARATQAAKEKELVKQGALALQEQTAKLEEQLRKYDQISGKHVTDDLKALEQALQQSTPKEAMAKLNEFEQQMQKEFSDQRQFEQATNNLPQTVSDPGLAPESQKDLQKLLDELRQQKFDDAAKDLQKLAQQMTSETLTPEQKQALAQQLQEALSKMPPTPAGQQLQQALQQMQAGNMDPKAMQQAQQASAQQMQQMAQQLQQMQALKDMKTGLADAKKGMNGQEFAGFDPKAAEDLVKGDNAQQASLGMKPGENGAGMQPGEGQGDGKGGASMGKMGMFSNEGDGQGSGTGSRGQSTGGKRPIAKDNTASKPEMSPTTEQQGKVLQEVSVSGVPEKGEALKEYTATTRAAREQALSSLSRSQVPRDYEDMVKGYFDSLEKKDK